MKSYLRYPATNESLLAIEKGLCPKLGDKVLSICGSGDQSFLFLSSGCKVIAIDKCLKQVDYVKKRKQYLELGDYERFLQPPGYSEEFNEMKKKCSLDAREEYLSRNCFELMRPNANNLDILEPQNILEHAFGNSNTYSKIYLSNCIEHIVNADSSLQDTDEKLDFELICLKTFGLSLKPGGVLYVS